MTKEATLRPQCHPWCTWLLQLPHGPTQRKTLYTWLQNECMWSFSWSPVLCRMAEWTQVRTVPSSCRWNGKGVWDWTDFINSFSEAQTSLGPDFKSLPPSVWP